MPPVVAAVAVTLIGLAAGAAGDAWVLAGAAAFATGAVARVRQPWLAVALAALAIGAALRGSAHRWREAACATALQDAARVDSVTVVVDVDAPAGSYVPGRARLPWCSMAVGVQARVATTGGVVLRIDAPFRAGARRPVAELRRVRPVAGAHDPLRAWRAAAARRIDARFGGDAPLVRALVVADMHDIDDATRTRWARAGLVHALSVSGLHVGIVAGVLALLAQALGARPARAAALSTTGLVAYVAVIGAPAPAVRAAVMFGAVALARARQRPTSPWAALALGALAPALVDAAAPLDLGWQLSVGGIASLECAGALVQRLGLTGDRWRTRLARELLAGSVASVASAPLVAWHMGTISLVAPVTNIAAAPLFTLVQPTLFLALLLDPVAPASQLVADAAMPMLRALDGVARVGAAPAWSAITVAPTLVACCAAGAMIAALLAAVVRRTAGPPLVIAGASSTVLAWAPLAPRGDAGVVELHVLDVGQGDALALRTPHGRWLLVDAGPGPPIAPDAGRRTIIPYVRRRGGEVATLVLTHPDLDHVGGAPTLLAALEPDALVEPGFLATSGAYEGLLDSALAHGVAWRPSRRGLSLDLDGVRVRVLAPDSAWLAAQRDPNEASTILRIEYGAMAMLLVGDAEREQEAWLLANATADELRADVLKVGHHGSRTSSTAAFLDAVRPRVALVSVGRGNRYGHPAPSVLAALAARGAAVFRTDVAGTLVLRTNGRSLELVTATGTWSPESSSRSAPAGAVSSPP